MKAEKLREELLACADMEHAARIANEVHRQIVDQMNVLVEAGAITVPTGIFTNLLIARQIVSVTGRWIAESTKSPDPEGFKAAMDILTNLPPCIDTVLCDDQGNPTE